MFRVWLPVFTGAIWRIIGRPMEERSVFLMDVRKPSQNLDFPTRKNLAVPASRFWMLERCSFLIGTLRNLSRAAENTVASGLKSRVHWVAPATIALKPNCNFNYFDATVGEGSDFQWSCLNTICIVFSANG